MKTVEHKRIPESKGEKWLQEALEIIRHGPGTESRGKGTSHTKNLPGPKASRSRYISYWVTKQRLKQVEKGIYAENDWDPLQQQLPVHIAEVVLNQLLTWEDLFERENIRRIAASLGINSEKIGDSYGKVLRFQRESIEKAIANAFVIRLQKSSQPSDSENSEDMVITPFREGQLPGPLSSKEGRRAEEKIREANRWHYELARKYENKALSRFYGHPL